MIYTHITQLIGNTPLLRIDPAVHKLKNIDLYAKLEYYNPFGSIKDRIAWGMLAGDLMSIKKKKQRVIESSSGNVAKAMQAICSIYDIPFSAYTNRFKVPETRSVIQLLGADIKEFPGMSECPDPTIPDDIVGTIEKLVHANPKKYYHPSQYFNPKNVRTHYETTGKEIYEDLGVVDYVFGGLGTSGTTTGVGTYLREKNPNTKVIGIVADGSDFIPGIRTMNEMWEVGIFDKSFYSDIVPVSSEQAINGMLAMVHKSGIFGGPTSGAVYAGMVSQLRKHESKNYKQKAVFIVCDRMEWYLSYIQKRRPDLFGAEAISLLAKDMTPKEVSEVPTIAVTDFAAWKTKLSPIVIDIRGNYGYRLGHIEGSINIDGEIIEDMVLRGRPFPEKQPLMLVCGVGDQSARLAAYLRKNEYMAWNLTGGITAWKQAGQKLISVSTKECLL